MAIRDTVDNVAYGLGFQRIHSTHDLMIYTKRAPSWDSVRIRISEAELKQCEGGDVLARWLERKFHQGGGV